MAQTPYSSPKETLGDASASSNYLVPLVILTTLFFMWGFLTSLNDVLIPYFKKLFDLSFTQAVLIQFCFFAAYGLCSIPSGLAVRKIGYQRGAVVGLIIAALGCALFVSAANQSSYALFLGALFILASGITLLQVSANPYVALLGPSASAPRRLTLTQTFNSLGAWAGPKFGGPIILGSLATATVITADAVKAPYLYLGVALFVLAIFFMVVKLPKVQDETAEGSYAQALSYRHLVLGVVAIFVYVGAEVSIGSFIINYMAEPHIAGTVSYTHLTLPTKA